MTKAEDDAIYEIIDSFITRTEPTAQQVIDRVRKWLNEDADRLLSANPHDCEISMIDIEAELNRIEQGIKPHNRKEN